MTDQINPTLTWDQQNRTFMQVRMHKAYDERDAAYKSALRDLDAGVPLAHVVNYLRRRYARIHRAIYLTGD